MIFFRPYGTWVGGGGWMPSAKALGYYQGAKRMRDEGNLWGGARMPQR